MDNMVLLTELGVSLTTLAFKGTVAAAHTKIETIKNEKNIENIKNTYDEIVNQLISERQEAIRIAQVYKNEIEKVEISDKDIIYLHNTVSKILEILKPMSANPAAFSSFEQLKELISVDALKTMQLLGFNYKNAIGEPLTELCADKISSLGNNKNSKNYNGKKK